SDFLADVCVKWEEAARRLEGLGLRVVRVRTGIALARNGGALKKLLPPFVARLGGPVGGRRQGMSWVHLQGLVDLYLFALENETVEGALNGTAPEPARNAEFGSTLHRALGHRRAFVEVPVPALALKVRFGEMSSAVLEGQRVVPARPLALGFAF